MGADKLDLSKPEELQTRDGRAIRIYATDAGGSYPIHGAILDSNETVWYPCSWTGSGTILLPSENSRGDLVLKPQRVTGWVNMYGQSVGTTVHPLRGDAIKWATSGCTGQIYVDAEVQVGE